MKIITDVSSLYETDYLTGIQRTTIEVLARLISFYGDNCWLVTCKRSELYQRVDNSSFLQKYYFGKSSCPLKVLVKTVNIDDMTGDNSIFFDIDAVWNHAKDVRQFLYPKLKKRNIGVFTYVYDIIPITHPQFAAEDNYFFFPRYIAAVLAYADRIIPSTEYTVKELQTLCRRIELPGRPEVFSTVPLGCDFANDSADTAVVPSEVRELAEKGKYILCVSTIEPRKNHELLLDAMESDLKNEEINFVFVGRYGWNIEQLKERIETSPQLGKKLFHMSGLNNTAVKYLYEHAYVVAFPTWVEGYGLSTVEALMAGTPVLLSDTEVSHEVGLDYCDYFDPKDASSFSDAVKRFLHDSEYYEYKKRLIKGYTPQTWDDSAKKLRNIIESFCKERVLPEDIELNQMLFYTESAESILDTLPFYERYLKFLKKVMVICPDAVKQKIQEKYKGVGTLEIGFLTEEELLNGISEPINRYSRIFILCYQAAKREAVDQYFLFSEGSYRPIRDIKKEFFCKNGKIRAYYCYDLDDWPRNIRDTTLFDESLVRTNSFLKKAGFPNMMYASGMPQMICKEYLTELIERCTDIEKIGGCIYSLYFNYLVSVHPHEVTVEPYRTVAWPAKVSDWDQMIIPNEYCFEKYDEAVYQPDGLFAGLDCFLSAEEDQTGLIKIEREKLKSEEWKKAKYTFQEFEKEYREKYRDHPSIVLDSERKMIRGPRFLKLRGNAWSIIPVAVKGSGICSIGWGKRKEEPENSFYVNGRKQLYLPFFCESESSSVCFFAAERNRPFRLCAKIKLIAVTG